MELNGLMNKLILFSLTTLFLISCGEEPKKKTSIPIKKTKKITIERPDFNADSAYSFIETQVNFGPRVPNTESHVKAGKYLSKKLGSYGFNIIEQNTNVTAFNGVSLEIKNIIGEYLPEKNNRILLFAHWDTRPFADQDTKNKNKAIDGANDGASGVGVLLEIARQIQIKKPNIGVDIIFFDAEDYGQPLSRMTTPKPKTWCLGSQYWCANPHKSDYFANYGILLDMVGAENAFFTKEGNFSIPYAPHVVDKVWNNAKALGHGNQFVFQTTYHVGEDDHKYINELMNIPSIDIIQYDPATRSFGKHWHTHEDNMSVINKTTLKAVGETVLATVLKEGK
jgi:hypothetical protein